MIRSFRASAFAYEELAELNCQVVVLAETEDGEGFRLEIQRSIRPGASDFKLGMEGYCLVLETQATHYGGVRAWSFEGRRLSIQLDPDAARVLQVDGFEIELDGASSKIAIVRNGLEQVLGNHALRFT